MKIVAIGEILWDVFEDRELLGGAPFNFAVHASRLGHEVAFVSAVGDDIRGRRALRQAEELGLPVHLVKQVAGKATGSVTVMLDAKGQPSYKIHRPAAYDFVSLSEQDRAAIAKRDSSWIYYGTLHQMSAQARNLTRELLEMSPSARRLYDVNLRRDSCNPSLVRELMQLATTLKLNDEEVSAVESMLGTDHGSLEGFCRAYSAEFGWDAVCVTRGAAGCSVLIADEFAEAAGCQVQVVDTVGAGDAFAAAFVHGLDQGWPALQVGAFANTVGALVASRAGGVPFWTRQEIEVSSSSPAGQGTAGLEEA